MTQQLTITLDGKTVIDVPVVQALVNVTTPWEEIVSNPAMAAALAGAPISVIKDLPGEEVAMIHSGAEIEITYKMRFRADNTMMTEFRPRAR